VQILERWAAPLQAELCNTLTSISGKLASMRRESTALAVQLNPHRRLEADRHHLFLGKRTGTPLDPCRAAIGRCGCATLRSTLELMATCHIPATPYVRSHVTNHILGDLIYLKHHYKHWSLDTTALYALNAQQEQELFDEVLHAVREKKIRVIEHCCTRNA
jgi:hypothetical protein